MNENENLYVHDFTKLQKLKADLFKNKKHSEYSEDLNHFKTTKFSLKKKTYIHTKHQTDKLVKKLATLYLNFLSMKQLYIKSRSDTFEAPLKALFEDITKTKADLTKIKKNLQLLFIDISTHDSHSTPSKPSSTPSKISPVKKKSVKKFLFNTYEQCISQKTKQPTYMSKTDIIKHIKEHDPTLLKHLPKKINAMKKEDICKVIFP